MSPVLESPDLLQCHSPVAAGHSWHRDTCFSFKGQAVARAALLLKLSHLSSAETPLAAFAPALVHRHLRKLMRVICVLCTQRCKAVAHGLALLSSLQLPELGGQDPAELPVPLWLAEISLPFNWHPVLPRGLAGSLISLMPAMHSTSLCSATLPVTCHAGLLTWTVSLWGSYQQCCLQDCFSRHGYQFNLLKICHKEK